LVPTSVFFILRYNIKSVFSGMLLLVFIMVFIGGLIVILVSVASVAQQEQKTFVSVIGLLLCVACLSTSEVFRYKEAYTHCLDLLPVSFWVRIVVVGLLVISLISITHFLLSFKGLVRGL